jgi:hypothetical protein
MAHTVLLPTQFTFTSRKARWIRGSINLRSFDRELSNCLLVSISSPLEYRGVVRTISQEFLPNHIRRQLPSCNPLARELKRTPIDVLLCLPPRDNLTSWEPLGIVEVDPWRCRHEFLSLKRSTDKLLRFLNEYGAWSEDLSPRRGRGLRGQWGPKVAFEAQLWVEQDHLRKRLKRGASEWFKGGGALKFTERSEYPHYVHEDGNCSDAIKTSIAIDFLRRTHFKLCARKDCGTPFPADRKGKRYCKQYCAHLASVRKGRKSGANRKGE